MSGIDWEGLLGAEGDELQDAYDAAVDEWDRQYGDPDDDEIWEMQQEYRARRRLFLYQSEDAAERQAIRKALEARLHTQFMWICFGGEDGKPDLSTRRLVEMVEERPRRVVMTNDMNQIVVLGRRQTDEVLVYWDKKVYDYIAQPQNPFQDRHVDFLKQQYDDDGMPVQVTGRYYEVLDDGYYREELDFDNYVVWQRSKYQEEELTWVFERVCTEGEPLSLRPVELWKEDKKIWQERLFR